MFSQKDLVLVGMLFLTTTAIAFGVRAVAVRDMPDFSAPSAEIAELSRAGSTIEAQVRQNTTQAIATPTQAAAENDALAAGDKPFNGDIPESHFAASNTDGHSNASSEEEFIPPTREEMEEIRRQRLIETGREDKLAKRDALVAMRQERKTEKRARSQQNREIEAQKRALREQLALLETDEERIEVRKQLRELGKVSKETRHSSRRRDEAMGQ